MIIRFQQKCYECSFSEVHEYISFQLNLEAHSYTLRPQGAIVEICLLTRGGKGGFGLLLKRKGMKVKIHNYQSSRDLTGRRLRDVEAPARNLAIAKQKQWEEKIVRAFGGEDPCLCQKMTALESIEIYQIRLPDDSADPFKIKADNMPDNPTYFITAAADFAAKREISHVMDNSSGRPSQFSKTQTEEEIREDVNTVLADIDLS